MFYRNANNNDLNQIISMKNRVKNRIIKENLPIWLNGYPTDELIEMDIENNYGRVIEIDGKVVGYAMMIPSEILYMEEDFETKDLYSFGRVMVDDNYTKLGIGRFLITSIIKEVKENGYKGLKITADDCNIKAVKLYESLGFKKEGEKQFPYAYLSIFGLYF